MSRAPWNNVLHPAVETAGLLLAPAPTAVRGRRMHQIKKIQNNDGPITKDNLPKINPFKLRATEKALLELINSIEDYPDIFPGKELPEGYHRFGTKR